MPSLQLEGLSSILRICVKQDRTFHFSGSCYNVIRVPPEKVDLGDTIHGAQVICSIASAERMKPSYYHSFGEPRDEANCNEACLNVTVAEGLALTSIINTVYQNIVITIPNLHFNAS